MVSSFFEESIVKRAIEKGLVEIEIVNLRDFAKDNYKTVDDKPYGGGAGMVLKVDVLHKAIKKVSSIKYQVSKTVLTSPRGLVYRQSKAKEYSELDHLVIVAGHYEGVDERVREYIDEEISLGDFVMTGGEITAVAVADSIIRLLPGVLKKEEASQIESFFEVPLTELVNAVGEHEKLVELQNRGVSSVCLLEYPHFTRPGEFEGKKVPEILLSGHHAEIEKWRLKMAFEETFLCRPDLLEAKENL
jgi:tRNA (guanine37-N1)-methyltransferase